jgi:tRNA(His) 5'-end guanylyltransferase
MPNDALGDRCKHLEMAEAGRRAMLGLPLLARLDGRAFHTFTRGLARPFDARMTRCMVETTKFLVHDLQARVGYTQSDEITLCWYEEAGSATQYPFDGRFQKLCSVLAGLASARFCQLAGQLLPEKAEQVPCLDCRVWQVPTLKEALEVFVWREDDATKNSISMAACAFYSDRELHGKDSAEKQEMLFRKGQNWNDYPAAFKRGTYVQRRSVQRTLTNEEWSRIPEAHRPPRDQLLTRGVISELDLPPIRKLGNAIPVLFYAAEPEGR